MAETPASTVWHELEMPSRLLPYKGVTKLEARVMKGSDEKIISELTTEDFDRVALELFRRILKGIDPAELTLGDRMYLMLWNAINSYTKNFPIDTVCGECFKPLEGLEVDLSQLELMKLPEDYKEPFGVALPICGEVVRLRLFRIKDQLAHQKYEADATKDMDDPWLYRLALSIVDDKNVFQRIEWLQNLTTRDLSMIRAFHEEFNHGVKMEYKFKCPKCGEGTTTDVPFRIAMFVPDGTVVAKSLGQKLRADVLPPRTPAGPGPDGQVGAAVVPQSPNPTETGRAEGA